MRSRFRLTLAAFLTLLGMNTRAGPARTGDSDPIHRVIDHALDVTDESLTKLRALRAGEKFLDLPGLDTRSERLRLSRVLNELLDRLIAGVAANPSKLWVMRQFQSSLVAVEYEDTEAREPFGEYLWQIMQALGIQSSDGLLAAYL